MISHPYVALAILLVVARRDSAHLSRELTDFTKIDSISQNWLSTKFLCVWAIEIKIQICGRPVPLKKNPGWTKKPSKTAFFGQNWPKNDQISFQTLASFKKCKVSLFCDIYGYICARVFKKTAYLIVFWLIFLIFL